MICFSLKQIEYLQFYIHEMRLADPAWTNYLAKLNSGNDEDKPKEGEVLEEPRYVEAENPWVPLPAGIMRESDMAEIVRPFFLLPCEICLWDRKSSRSTTPRRSSA